MIISIGCYYNPSQKAGMKLVAGDEKHIAYIIIEPCACVLCSRVKEVSRIRALIMRQLIICCNYKLS